METKNISSDEIELFNKENINDIKEDFSYKEKKKLGLTEQEITDVKLKKMKIWIDEQDVRMVDKEGNKINLFDKILKHNLYFVAEDMRKDYDHFIVITGTEGTGKSKLAINIASYLDPTFNIDRVCLTTKDFIAQIQNCKKQALIMDEAAVGLYSRQSMSAMNILLNKIFMISRAKNLCIILCIPSLFALDSYIRLHRVNTLLHLPLRSHYIFYNGQKIKSLSIDGGKYMNMNSTKGWYVGNCNNKCAPNINWDEYVEKKNKYIDVFLKELIDFKDYQENKELIKKENQAKTSENRNVENKMNEATVERKFFRVSEVSKMLHMSPAILRQGIYDDEIPHINFGSNRYLISKEFIDKKLEEAKNSVKV